VKAGFRPADFWDETPRSFVTIMEGAARAAEQRHERELMVAHHGAAWTGAAYGGKLKRFRDYCPSKSQLQPQSGDQMLGVIMSLHEMGAPMKIEQIN
jgi:hypothetical protein